MDIISCGVKWGTAFGIGFAIIGAIVGVILDRYNTEDFGIIGPMIMAMLGAGFVIGFGIGITYCLIGGV